MKAIQLGKTGLVVPQTSFGALPIQRRSMADAKKILRAAYNAGIKLYDTARAYSDSEEKLGAALHDVRDNIIIATKTHADTLDEMKEHLETSLRNLQSDYIDIYQFHNPDTVPLEDDPRYQYMLQLKKKGIVRHIGLSAHSAANAIEAAKSGLYEIIQYPVSCISNDRDLEVVKTCKALNIGMLGMKGMAGGLIKKAALSFAFLRQFDHVAPIWGIQHMHELEEFLAFEQNPPVLDELLDEIEEERKALSGDFCRGCGYCLKNCPAQIEINACARMTLFLGRAPWQSFMTEEWKEAMDKIDDCIECGNCKEACPYKLDVPQLLKKNLTFYREFKRRIHNV